ncbi:MAG TPA: glycosyltransferase [Polyangia bacterium]|nr:glycosyltransferase [Polyangia bacterium]
MSRRRLAIFSPGGIGGGAFSQGQPAIASLVGALAARFELTFYSLAAVDPRFAPDGYRLRAPSTAWTLARAGLRGARWADLARRFAVDHRAARYHQLLALWGYPMGAFVVALARLSRLPAAVVLLGGETADLPAIGYGQLGRPIAGRLVRETCRRADALIAVSRHQLDRLAARGVSRPDAQVVPIGAEADLFPFEARRRAPPLKLLHVANLTAVKDQTTLLRAFARVRAATEARLRVVGDGERRGELEALAGALGIAESVELVGAVPFRRMPDHYRWADMFVLTSLSEGQNRALTEAAMCGVLQVSTPVGHIADLGDAVAVVVPAGDPETIAARILAVAGDADGWQRRVSAARAWAAAHDLGWTARRMTELLGGTEGG